MTEKAEVGKTALRAIFITAINIDFIVNTEYSTAVKTNHNKL